MSDVEIDAEKKKGEKIVMVGLSSTDFLRRNCSDGGGRRFGCHMRYSILFYGKTTEKAFGAGVWKTKNLSSQLF